MRFIFIVMGICILAGILCVIFAVTHNIGQEADIEAERMDIYDNFLDVYLRDARVLLQQNIQKRSWW